MEFIELISISKIDNVILHMGCNESIEGTLCITGHHLILSSRKEQCSRELCILQQSIDHIEIDKRTNKQNDTTSTTINNINNSTNQLIIKCKDFRIIQLEIKNIEDFNLLYKTLTNLFNIIYNNDNNIKLLYPFYYRLPISIDTNTSIEDGYQLYANIELEYYKQLIQESCNDWRLTEVNKYYNLCKTYNHQLIVPKNIDDSTLIESSKYRQDGRIPLISYKHGPNNGGTGTILLRASQPLCGSTNKRSRSDERLLNSYLMMNNKSGYIIDTRSLNVATHCKSKGGGFEIDIYYPQWKRIHKSLDKINNSTTLIESLTKLIEACNDTNCTTDKWLSRLNNSDWLHYLLIVLNTSCIVAQSLHHDDVNVLVHGTYGLDTTILVTSLTQVILNPETRTVHGFQALIEREWLQNGYPFYIRHMHSCYYKENNKDNNDKDNTTNSTYINNNHTSPTFLLFLDCIQQLHAQFPCSFEFNTNYLILLFEHSYFSQYGTFIGNNQYERTILLKLYSTTTSLWTYLNQKHIKEQYLNVMYEENLTPIWPSIAPISFVLWSQLFLRYSINQKPIINSNQSIQSIQQHHFHLKSQVIQLRKQLYDLQLTYESLSN